MAAECVGALHVVRVRATRLDETGNPDPGVDGAVVTSHPMRIALNPEVEEGDDLIQKNGAGEPCLVYKSQDYIKFWNFEFDNCRLDPALMELMFGATLILDGADPIGNVMPSGIPDTTPLGVGLEFWTKAWDGDAQNVGKPYIRWVVPKSYWALGDNEFGAEFQPVSATGYSENNPNFGDPYGDMPAGYTTANTGGKVAWFLDTVLPEATCGYTELVGSGS